MTNQIFPCLWFDNQAKAASTFYCSVFGNSRITTESDLVVQFELEGPKVMGLWHPAGDRFLKLRKRINIGFCVISDSSRSLQTTANQDGQSKWQESRKMYHWLATSFMALTKCAIFRHGFSQNICHFFGSSPCRDGGSYVRSLKAMVNQDSGFD